MNNDALDSNNASASDVVPPGTAELLRALLDDPKPNQAH